MLLAPGSVLSQSCILKTQVGVPVESLGAGRPFWGGCRGPVEKHPGLGRRREKIIEPLRVNVSVVDK